MNHPEFLKGNQTSQEILHYHVNERGQERLRYLLMRNRSGILCDIEQLELDEIEKIDHLFIMFKIDMVEQIDKEEGTL